MKRQAVNYLVEQIGQRAKLRFHVHPNMLRRSTGYYLADRGYDTRLAQDYWDTRTSLTQSDTLERRGSALRECGGKKSVFPWAPLKIWSSGQEKNSLTFFCLFSQLLYSIETFCGVFLAVSISRIAGIRFKRIPSQGSDTKGGSLPCVSHVSLPSGSHP
jgi:hypothetical protein